MVCGVMSDWSRLSGSTRVVSIPGVSSSLPRRAPIPVVPGSAGERFNGGQARQVGDAHTKRL